MKNIKFLLPLLLVVLSTSLFGQYNPFSATGPGTFSHDQYGNPYYQSQIHDPDSTPRYILNTWYVDNQGVQRQREDVCIGGFAVSNCIVTIPLGVTFLYQDVYPATAYNYGYPPNANRYIFENQWLDGQGYVFPSYAVCHYGQACNNPFNYQNLYHQYWQGGNPYRINGNYYPGYPNQGYPSPTVPYTPPVVSPLTNGANGTWLFRIQSTNGWVAVGVAVLNQPNGSIAFQGDISLSGNGYIVECGSSAYVTGTNNGGILQFNIDEPLVSTLFIGTFNGYTAAGTYKAPNGGSCMNNDSGAWTAVRQ